MIDAWTPFNFHAGQQAYISSTAQFNDLVCGRRAGKTELACRKLVKCARSPLYTGARYIYLCPTRRQGKKIAWQRLKDLVGPNWMAGSPNETELIIRTITGGQIEIDGMDAPQRLEGTGVVGVVADESSDMKPGAIQQTVMPMLTWALEQGGWMDRIGVPKVNGPSGLEFKESWEKGLNADPAVHQSFRWPSWDVCPPGAIETLRKNMSMQVFREQCGAEWISHGGAAFHAFDKDRNVRPCGYHDSLPIRVGSDFNVEPMCWVLSHWHGNHYEYFEELEIDDTHTQATLDILKAKYHNHTSGWEFYGDASAQARTTSGSMSDYRIIQNDPDFRRMGRTIHYPRGNPLRLDRFGAFNAMLCNAVGERRIYIDQRCDRLIQDLRHRGLDAKTETGTRMGHMSDAASYIVWQTHPQLPSEEPINITVRAG